MQKSKVDENSFFVHKNSYPLSKLMEIQREFHVPVDKLFDAFTSSAALKV